MESFDVEKVVISRDDHRRLPIQSQIEKNVVRRIGGDNVELGFDVHMFANVRKIPNDRFHLRWRQSKFRVSENSNKLVNGFIRYQMHPLFLTNLLDGSSC